MAQSLVRLYPASWRARYGEEFATLIEDSPSGWRAIFDVVKGAIRMRLHVPAFPKLAVIVSMVGLVTGLIASLLVTPRYVSRARMEVVDSRANSPQAAPRPRMPEYLISLEQEILSRTSLSTIIQDPRLDLYRDQRQGLPLEDVIEQMRSSDIRISMVSSGSNYAGFTIAFTYSDAVKARDTVQTLVTKFSDSSIVRQRTLAKTRTLQSPDPIDRLEARIAAAEKKLGIVPPLTETVDAPSDAPVDGIDMNVIEAPNLPSSPVYPDRWQFMAIGFGAGFATAVVIAALRRRTPPIPFQPAQPA